MPTGARRHLPGRLALALVALALLLRLLLPAGLMPSAAAGGFVLCTADGLVPLSGTDPAAPQMPDPCPYAVAATPALPPAPPRLALPVDQALAATDDPRPLAASSAAPPGLPPATGPPARA